jgi:hypothetical protein
MEGTLMDDKTDDLASIDFAKASDLAAGDVVFSGQVANIAEHDSVPPCEQMTVESVSPATVQGYVQVTQAGGDSLYVRADRLLPVSKGHGGRS